MVTRADSLGIRPVASSEATAHVAPIGDARQETLDRFTPAAIGKLFKAEVLSTLTDGSFTVKLADVPGEAAVKMNLPAGTQVGDKITLTLVATQPRPTFALPTPQGNPAAQTSAELSSAGKLIDTLLRTAQSDGAPATLVGKTALVASPDASPTQVAVALKNTLTYSGLFYESHVSQWASGSRSLTELMHEPQAKYSDPKLVSAALQSAVQQTGLPADATGVPVSLSAAATNAATTDTASAQTGQSPTDAASPSPHPGSEAHITTPGQAALQAKVTEAEAQAALLRPTQDGATETTHSLSASSASLNPQDVSQAPTPTTTDVPDNVPSSVVTTPVSTSDAQVDTSAPATTTIDTSPLNAMDGSNTRPEATGNDTARMVSLQLDTLEHQRVMWRGELWPGQQMEWEVSEDAPEGHGQSGGERAWQSTLRVDLPSLGIVSATIRLSGQHVQVQVRAASEATALLLRSHGNSLASAMDAAGAPLDLLTVRQDATA